MQAKGEKNAPIFPWWKTYRHVQAPENRPEEREVCVCVCVCVCVWYSVCEDGYLQLPQGVVTLLLSCCLLGTERDQLVNTLCHCPETHRQPHRLFSSHMCPVHARTAWPHSLTLTHSHTHSHMLLAALFKHATAGPLSAIGYHGTQECRDCLEFVLSFAEHRQALAKASIFLIRQREVSQAQSPAGPAAWFCSGGRDSNSF